MSVLFTGHRGFLGRELVSELRLIDNVVFFEGDLTDFSALKKFAERSSVRKVLHAAARGGRRTKVETQETFLNNVRATTSVLGLELPTILFCSGAIYNRENSIEQAKEEESLSSFPSDFYGQSKFVNTALARDRENCNTLRFFNVFGPTEGMDRFISFNIHQYCNKQPMKIFVDFEMDFFYVLDTLSVLYGWLRDKAIPKELNMVYPEKVRLSDICKMINTLSDYSVPIQIQDPSEMKNYSGSGELLSSMKLPQIGLMSGLEQMHVKIKKS